MVFPIKLVNQGLCNGLDYGGSVEKIAFFDASGLYAGPVEKWEMSTKFFKTNLK